MFFLNKRSNFEKKKPHKLSYRSNTINFETLKVLHFKDQTSLRLHNFFSFFLTFLSLREALTDQYNTMK